jgi:signal transduction histidine kinase
MKEINAKIAEIYRVTLGCFVATAAVSFILISVISKSISRPVKRINEAARFIASGNFDKRINYSARDEIGQLSRSFDEMAESLDNQENTRREFITNISHDLRSPLTSMRGFLQAIIDGTVPEEKRQHYLNIILEESERLGKLANDILNMNSAQILADRLNLIDFDLNELIRKTVIMFEPKIEAKKIGVSVIFYAEAAAVHADYEKIQRVIYNLIDNAIKFVDEGGAIAVESDALEDKAFISVRDNGRGISAEDQKYVFDRFYKADSSRNEDKGGRGLGLAIAREFIRAHGEVIAVKSEPGKGCQFKFSLPLSKL